MTIGILVTMMNNFGQAGFYHSQEVGMAKALSRLGHRVVIYKFIREGETLPENVKLGDVLIQYHGAKAVGINGLISTDPLEKNLDALRMFGDTQLCVPRVYRWCRRHNVTFIPYIGAAESHSQSGVKARIVNMLFHRNLRVYRKSVCLAKNADVKARLEKLGVANVVLAPVGIDPDALNPRYHEADPNALKEKYGFAPSDQVILYIGRLEPEKNPVKVLELFQRLHNTSPEHKLLLVGKGVLEAQVKSTIRSLGLEGCVKWIPAIPNREIWELYRLCCCFVNLNRNEIFGMVLLEAMYYEAKVVAWHAPGPDFIIEDGRSGFLVSSDQAFLDAVLAESPEVGGNAHRRVAEQFTWDATARLIEQAARP